MSGNKLSKEKLNVSLVKIATILNKHKFNKWFIAYGTLLGIVRNKSCIDGDDDIDRICDMNDYEKLKDILKKEGYEFEFGYEINDSKLILKTKESRDLASIDFYMSEVDMKGNFNDLWEKVVWSNCYLKNSEEFIKINWKNTTLNLPNNYFNKLKKRYGFFWRIPQNNKGNRTHKQSKVIKLLLKMYNKLPFEIKTKLKKFIKRRNFLYKFIKVKSSSKV